MPPLELEGRHLGEKHRSYNELIRKTAKGESHSDLNTFNEDDDDITNLMKIDKACDEKNLDYVLKVLVCNDMLYVSRVLKRCKWLLEKEYEHIVNPQNLYDSLFPKMCTKASIKFIKNLQRHLKDANRVEKFYEYEENVMKAINWLPYCSLEFIEKNLHKHVGHMKIVMIRRLCERSFKNLQIYIDSCKADYKKTEALEATTFLIRTHTLQYLDLDATINDFRRPKFSPVTTKIIMKTCSNRIIENFDKFCNRIHLPTFIAHLGTENIKEFLLNQALKAQEDKIYVFAETFKVLVENIPIKERFDFIKKVFIDKEFKNEACSMSLSEKKVLKYLYEKVCHVRFYKEHTWYKHAPFNVTLDHLKSMVEDANDEDIKSMLNVLVSCARTVNVSDINTLIQYVKNTKKIRSKTTVRNDFVKNLLTETNFKMFNCDMWLALEEIVKEANDPDEHHDTCNTLTWALICYKVINSENITENLLNAFKFDTFKIFQGKFNTSEKQLIFNFLYETILTKLKNKTCCNEEELKEWTVDARHALQLLIDWEKELNDYPSLLDEIKTRINNHINNNYKVDLSFIYNTKKAWKKYLFHESIYLCQNDYTFINSLKHDPMVLQNYVKSQNHTVLLKISPLRKFLRKIRVYYPTSIGKDWLMLYNENLDNVAAHKTISFGILTLSSRAEFERTLKEFAPNPNTTDADISEFAWSLRRYLAKTMHFSRPQPSPELLFPYTKGDYLKYALPSLFSIFYNLSPEKVPKFIPHILDAQVSLQKHGIRFAFDRLPSSESSIIFEERWKSAKNLSIRSVLFKVVFELLCKEKDEDRVKNIWNLFTILTENLTFKENEKVYDLLFHIDKLPSKIQAPYYMNVYYFLKKLSTSKEFSDKYSYRFNNDFVPYSTTLMDQLSSEFVTKILLEFISEGFDVFGQYNEHNILAVISSFCFNAKETDLRKYTEIYIPFHNFCNGNDKKSRLDSFLDRMREDITKTIDKKRNVPLELFVAIQKKLQESMPVAENYILLTKWNLTISFVENLQKDTATSWDEMCSKMAPTFGKICSSMLREHCKTYFPYIYILFAKALKQFFADFIDSTIVLDIILNMLDESVESYLVALKLTKYFSQHRSDDDTMKKTNNLKKMFNDNPSGEIKIHYYRTFNEFNDNLGAIYGCED